jgi:PiT family inorganic phosphate transporter
MSIVSGDSATCRTTIPTALRVTADGFHWLSSGAASFARGLNDAPKIVGLALAAGALTSTSIASMRPVFFLLVTAGIVIGSLAAGLRVTRVLAEDVTPMSHREGLAANLVTAMLVAVGAVNGLPMSTTHVSSGAIMGIGAERGSLNWRTARTIVAAWIVTLPAAAVLAAACYAAVRMVTS